MLVAPLAHRPTAVLVGAALGVLLTAGPFHELGDIAVLVVAFIFLLLQFGSVFLMVAPHSSAGGECFSLCKDLLELVKLGTDIPEVLLLDVLGSSSLWEDFWEPL